MKGKILVSVFGLPFFGVGVWMLYTVSSALVDAGQMQDWVQVEASLTRGGYETHRGDDSYTYEAYAEYNYTFQDDTYTGNRVGLSGGADNIGDYQQDTGRNLSNALSRGDAILVYVDPNEPSSSIIDRGVRWGMIGFQSIFLFVFGGIGLAILIAVWRAGPAKDKANPRFADRPWLLDDDWQSATVRSSSKASMVGVWAFAAIWNLISAPLPFVMYDEVVNKENYLALVALLFTAVGIGLFVWAVRRTLEWRRFGATPVTLDPFPGSIGGHVGGTIQLGLLFDPAHVYRLTLTNIHSYVSGSGDNRSKKEKAKWQDSIIAHAEPGSKGTKLTFRFDVPDGLDESDTDRDDNYYLWRLNLNAELEGTDIDRSFEIPVFATATQSRHLSRLAVEKSRDRQDAVNDRSVRDVVNLQYGATGKRMLFPMGRHIKSCIGGFLIGGTFTGAGWFLIFQENHPVFGSVFGGVGTLIAILCLYMMLNSLEVSQAPGGIRTVRRVLGIPIKRTFMQRDAFVRFEKNSSFQSQGGGKHTIHYSIYAIDTDGDKVIVGEGFKGESEVKAAMRLIAAELGLNPDTTESPDDVAPDSLIYNALAADN